MYALGDGIFADFYIKKSCNLGFHYLISSNIQLPHVPHTNSLLPLPIFYSIPIIIIKLPYIV